MEEEGEELSTEWAPGHCPLAIKFCRVFWIKKKRARVWVDKVVDYNKQVKVGPSFTIQS